MCTKNRCFHPFSNTLSTIIPLIPVTVIKNKYKIDSYQLIVKNYTRVFSSRESLAIGLQRDLCESSSPKISKCGHLSESSGALKKNRASKGPTTRDTDLQSLDWGTSHLYFENVPGVFVAGLQTAARSREINDLPRITQTISDGVTTRIQVSAPQKQTYTTYLKLLSSSQ